MHYSHRIDAPVGERRTIDFAWLEISNRCNLICRHCYAESGPHESSTGTMQFDDWCAVMDQLREIRCEGVQFIGGEPTLHPRFLDMVAAARRKGFEYIEVYTNATRLSETMCSELKKHDAQVAVSFYSADEETHDRITGRKGSFKRTVTGISQAVEHGLMIRAGIIGMDENADLLDEAERFVRDLGVNSVKVDRQRYVGRSEKAEQNLDPISQLCGACGSGSIAINADGEVSPCVFSHFFGLGHVSQGIAAIIRQSRLVEFEKQLIASRGMECSPRCRPHDCGPAEDPSPQCFPNSCDPRMCNPISCPPRD